MHQTLVDSCGRGDNARDAGKECHMFRQWRWFAPLKQSSKCHSTINPCMLALLHRSLPALALKKSSSAAAAAACCAVLLGTACTCHCSCMLPLLSNLDSVFLQVQLLRLRYKNMQLQHRLKGMHLWCSAPYQWFPAADAGQWTTRVAVLRH